MRGDWRWQLGLLLSLLGAVEVEAGGRAKVSVDGGLIVAPFAVPVAVPVARVLVPSVWYGYRVAMPEGVRAAEELPTREVEEVTAREVLEGRCGACHAGEEASGGLAIVDEEGELKEKLPRQRMWEAIEAGRMPRGEQKMSAEELELLREWVRPPKELEW